MPAGEEGAILGGLGLKDDAEVGILWNFTFFNWTNNYQIWHLGSLDVKDREKLDNP